MKKQTQLLSALALSVGLTLSAPFPAVASIPGQAALPSLAPMLEKVLPAVVSVRVEGTATQGQKVPEEFKKFLAMNFPINLHNLLKDWVQVSLLMPPKATS